ncbi:hypothetical protein Tco_0870583 [Tanacetum coccineum]
MISSLNQALDDALVPREQRLRIGNCNFRLSTTFKPKEPTFQVGLDVLSLTPFYQAFLISASVPAIYMHEFWATVSYHKHCIKFKMNKKNYSFDLESFRDMLQICPNLPGQKLEDPPFKVEILAFIRKLGYSRNMKSLSDVKVETLPQPWRTFGTIINKYLSGKVTGLGLLRLSRAQIMWGMYYQKNVDYVYLLWEDLVYQINKVSKNNKDMYYPRFTKVIINHFMSKDQSIPRRNKVDWHMANDDPILTTMRFIPKHETVQKYGAMLPDSLTNQAMKESDAYKTYHDFATGKVIPKPKYVRRSTREKTDQAPTASPGKRLKATAKKSSNDDDDDDDEVSMSKDDDDNADNEDDDGQDDENEQTESDNDGDDFVYPKFSTHNEEERQHEEDKEEEGSDLRVPTPSHFKSTDDESSDEVTQGDNVEGEELDEEETNEEEEVNELYRDVNVNLERRDTEMIDTLQTNSSSVSSGLISNMLNPNPDTGIDFILNLNTESTSLVDVPVTTNVEMPPSSVITLPPPPIPLIQPLQQTPVSTPTIALSTSLQNLPTFGSLFKFEDKVKALEDDFSEFKRTNLFAETVSSIPGIVDKIEKLVNDQLEAEVLICSSNEAKTSYAIEAPHMHKAHKKRRALGFRALSLGAPRKDILASYGDTVTFKRRRDDEDDDEEPSAGSNRGSKRRRARKEPESTSASKEKTSKPTGKSKEGSKSHQKSTDKDDDKMYTFKEGDYNRLRLQDIKDMLLLLVQGKLTNLNMKELLALGVSLRMNRRLMRSLEKFVGGRLYGGDLRLQLRQLSKGDYRDGLQIADMDRMTLSFLV